MMTVAPPAPCRRGCGDRYPPGALHGRPAPVANDDRGERRPTTTAAAPPSLRAVLLLLAAGAALAIRPASSSATAGASPRSTPRWTRSRGEDAWKNNDHNDNDFDDNDGVVRLDLSPASSYVRWLHRRLELLDGELAAGGTTAPGAPGADDSRGRRGGAIGGHAADTNGDSLRRLADLDGAPPSMGSSEHDNELLWERQLIERQLEEAAESLRGAGAAYASVAEFSPHRITGPGSDQRRHLKRSHEELLRHNEGIREYNEHYRRYSRYEWSVREGRGSDGVGEGANRSEGSNSDFDRGPDRILAGTGDGDGDGEETMTTRLLVGTSWKALEIAFNATDTVHPTSIPLDDHPITLSFDSDHISGKSGCNHYHGAVTLSPSENMFNTSAVGGTRMLCSLPEGVMERERMYLGFISRGRFFYEIEAGDREGGERRRQLVLTASISRSKGHFVQGEVVARFASHVEGAPRVIGDRRAAAAPAILGSSWGATDYNDGNALAKLLPGSAITLTVGEGSVSGHTDCNSYSGDVADVTAASFRLVGDLAVTERACADPLLNAQEASYLRNFRGGMFVGYEIADGEGVLRLRDGDTGAEIARFAPRFSGAKRGDDIVVARYSHLVQPADTRTSAQPQTSEHLPADSRRTLQASARAKKRGGLYNAYQTSPLHQGYGTHYATIWVGTPSQRKSVIVDTGSHFTAFPCKGCENCGEEHHTDKYFDPDASTTFRALGCDECRDSACELGRCVFSQTYTEGSSWHAYESVDKVFVGGKELSSALNPTNNAFKTDFLFGCQTKEAGLFVTQLADGIMGMSAHPSTLPRTMYDQGKLEHNMFSMCFRSELHVSKKGVVAGMLTLGGIDSRKDFAPMVYARNLAKSGWFTVFVKNVFIREKGGQSAKVDSPHQTLERIDIDLYRMNSGKGVIMDSGTTDTYLHESIAGPFERVWKHVTGGKTYSNEPVKMDKKELLLLPTVLIQLAAYDGAPLPLDYDLEKYPGLVGRDVDPTSPQDVLLAIPATHYMEYSPSKGTYTPRIYFTESAGGVIGANAMQGHNVLFDWENQRVGFAESSCEYQEESKTVVDDGNVMSVDCRLGAPSLSVSCSDSADLSQCKKEDPNGGGAVDLTVLEGLEIWTRVVQAPGMPHGKTCEEVSNEQNEENGGGLIEVNCDGKGVCREVRKCIISCANAIAHGSAVGSARGLAPIGSCGGVTWSACEHTCTQTRVNRVLMDDGKCHEEKNADGEEGQVTRPCHVQACGRSDPCRVPFVVHAILKVQGGMASRWTKQAEEIFTEAYAATVNGRLRPNAHYFEPGDVVVLNVSPWHASDDTIFGTGSLENGEDKELGMQLVVEASLFNPDAEVPPSSLLNRGGRRNIPLATCHERDMQPLENKASDIRKKLAQKNFIDLLVERMKKNEALGETQDSPFYYTFEDREFAKGSQVVTSWTIKTDIGVGSSGINLSSFKSGDVMMDMLLLVFLTVLCMYLCWSLQLSYHPSRSCHLLL